MTIRKLLSIGVLMCSVSACRTQEVQITFKVADDFGKPVPGATVTMATFERWKPGDGFGEDVYKKMSATTDKSGVATVKDTSPRAVVKYGISPLAGYYYGGGGEYSFKESKDGRWHPWNPTVELVLKPILNPVPMYAFKVDTSIPKPAQKYGFDLMIGDWIAPQGKGQASDIILEVTGYANSVKDYDSYLAISFPNAGDGIKPSTVVHSGGFRSLREAPLEGYQDKLVLHRARKPGQLSPDWIDDTKQPGDYFFRVRTVLDEKGKIKSALYGKIYGGFKFGGAVENGYLEISSCYLNPDSNSRNMEFDPKRNLFKGPKGKADISAP